MNSHYFWAVKIPNDSKHAMYQQLNTVKERFPFKRWVHMEDYHITLAFLGSVEEGKLPLTIDLVGKAISNLRPFSIYIEGLNVFGNKNAPRIFWASMKEEPILSTLQAQVFNACVELGFSLESRSFTPHITLARNWNGPEFQKEWLEKYNPFKSKSVLFTANEVTLYKTNIEKTPKYEPIATFSLLVE